MTAPPTLNTRYNKQALMYCQLQEIQRMLYQPLFLMGYILNSTEFFPVQHHKLHTLIKCLGGDVLDIELTEQNVYTSYELAVLEYSYIVNNHQAINVLSDFLGATTGTFDHKGKL